MIINNNDVLDYKFNDYVKKIHKNYSYDYNIFFKFIPDVINFLYKLNTYASNKPICFLSRDGYFLKKIYDALFPNNKTYYVYSSRAALNKASSGYIAYMKQFYDEDAIFIDIDGSNRSFYFFFKRNFGHVPKKFIFIFDAQFKYYLPDIDKNVKYYISNNKTPNYREYLEGHKLSVIENFFRAPHRSIIDVVKTSNSFEPIFEDIFVTRLDKFLKYIKNLIKDYVSIETLIRPNSFLFNEKELLKNIYRPVNKNNKGVAAFSIDNITITDNSLKNFEELVKYFQKNNYHTIIITSKGLFDINYKLIKHLDNIDLFYNVYQKNKDLTKIAQLIYAHKLANIAKNKRVDSFLLELGNSNTDLANEYGFSTMYINIEKLKINNFDKRFKNFNKSTDVIVKEVEQYITENYVEKKQSSSLIHMAHQRGSLSDWD